MEKSRFLSPNLEYRNQKITKSVFLSASVPPWWMLLHEAASFLTGGAADS